MQVRSLSGAPIKINSNMKNIIIYGLNRTGSTYVQRLVTHYTWLKYGKHYTIFDEFFSNTLNKYIRHYETANRGGIVSEGVKHDFYEMATTANTEETDQRILDTLNNYNEETPMLTKLHVGNLIDSPIKQYVYDYLNETSEFILIERDDTLNLVLSLAVARLAGMNNTHSEKNIPNYPRYSVTRDMFIEVYRWKYDYEQQKQKLKNIKGTINFNDIGINSVERFLDSPSSKVIPTNALGKGNNPASRDYSVPRGYFINGLETLRSLGFDDENILKKVNLSDLPIKLIPNKRKWALLENKDEALAWHAEIFGS